MSFRFILITCVLFVLMAMPMFAVAQSELVFCNTELDANGKFTKNCGYAELVDLAKRIINFLILLAIPLAALSFAYAGFLIMTAAGNSGQVSKGKEVFEKVAKGLMWALAAWLVVNLILTALLKENGGFSILDP